VRVEPGKARCRFHGGLSTGSRSEEGRARISEAQRGRWRAYRASKLTNIELAPAGALRCCVTALQSRSERPRSDSAEPAGAVSAAPATS
jgi:hypothetical protein